MLPSCLCVVSWTKASSTSPQVCRALITLFSEEPETREPEEEPFSPRLWQVPSLCRTTWGFLFCTPFPPCPDDFHPCGQWQHTDSFPSPSLGLTSLETLQSLHGAESEEPGCGLGAQPLRSALSRSPHPATSRDRYLVISSSKAESSESRS